MTTTETTTFQIMGDPEIAEREASDYNAEMLELGGISFEEWVKMMEEEYAKIG